MNRQEAQALLEKIPIDFAIDFYTVGQILAHIELDHIISVVGPKELETALRIYNARPRE